MPKRRICTPVFLLWSGLELVYSADGVPWILPQNMPGVGEAKQAGTHNSLGQLHTAVGEINL